jgi:hypothetical protein
MTKRLEHFDRGRGIEPEEHVCAECGYSSPQRKNFRRAESGGLTCSTGHYHKEGEMRRARNPYAKT